MNLSNGRSRSARTWVALFVLAAATVVGLGALYVRFRDGLMVTRMTQHVPWGLWIAFYIYFIGLSAGSFLLSTLVYVFRVKRFEAVGPLALVQALICLLLGMLLIFVDLGHPERFLNVFLYWNPTSVLAWECFFYTFYVVLILAELYIALRPALARKANGGARGAGLYRLLSLGGKEPGADWPGKAARWLTILGIIGIPVAIGVHGGTGAIFAVVKSRPSWYTGLFPIVFLVSALASGGALLTFLAALTLRMERGRKLALVRSLATLTIGVLALDLLLLSSEMLVTFYGGIQAHVIGAKLTLFGPYWWVFWFVQLGMGALLPILIVAVPATRNSIKALAVAGALVVVGIIGVRLNIVIPPQIRPEFPQLPEAYHQVRFAAGYFPSANEWLVAMFSVALGVWLFAAALKWLPLGETEAHEPAVQAGD